MSQTSSTESNKKQIRNDPADNHDGGKLRYDLIPTRPLRELCKVYTYGTTKYGDNNWRKGMAWSRAIGSLERHLQAFKAGDDIDVESGCLHLASVVFRAFQLMEYAATHTELDDRIKDREDSPRLNGPSYETTNKGLCLFPDHDFKQWCQFSLKHPGNHSWRENEVYIFNRFST